MNNLYFWLLTLGHFLVDFYGNFLPALLPVMAKKLDISMVMAGFVITATSLAANLVQVPAGYLFDRHPWRFWLPVTVLISATFVCVSGFMPSYLLFLLCPVLSGLGIGLYHPAGSSYAYSLAENNRGFMVSVFASFGSLGFALAPMVAGFVLHHGDLPALLWLVIPGLILAAGFHSIDFNQVAAIQPQNEHPRPTGKAMLSSGLLLLMLVMTLRAWGIMAITTYLPFLLETRGYSYTLAESLLTVFLVVGAVGGIGGAWLSDHIGRKPVIFSTLLAAAIGGGLFICTRGLWSLAFLAVCGLTVQMGQPVMVVLSQELMPDNVALASGVSMGLVWGIGALGVTINGWVADWIGFNWSFGLAIAVIFIAAAVTLLAPVQRVHFNQNAAA
ncbi:MAG: MFS transporter [Methylocystaceae bacterium]